MSNEAAATPAASTATDSLRILREVYGYETFRGEQARIIDTVVQGDDALVIMPTGGGKSVCYQIPALLRAGVGIVVSPLIALMEDQVAALAQLGVRAAYLNSTLTIDAQQAVRNATAAGELDLLYVAPERLLQPDTLAFLGSCKVALIAIDEAHCVSAWGHDFREDYLALGQLQNVFPNVPRLALTATADARTRDDIVSRLALSSPTRFIAGFDRPNITYAVQAKTDAKAQLLNFLEPRQGLSGIVYCLSRKSVEATAEHLRERGYNALPYHAGLDAGIRRDHQARFLREPATIMVATIAFGMGIDKPDVRFVAHLDLPKSMEAYYQETGRAGRDGEAADAWMVYGMQDVVRLGRMLDESQAGEDHKRIERSKLDALLGWCEITTCRRRALLAYFGETRDDDCGNCDTCTDAPVTWDATVPAQKLLSCAYRTGQRFGAGHVIDVLRGADNEKVRRFNHDALSTYGLGAEYSDQQWRSIVRQLVVRGYLRSDHDRYGALVLTGKARPLLRGEEVLYLREDRKVTRAKRRKSTYTLNLEDEALMDALKARRAELAEEAGVPPYVIFHDASLLGMVEHRPSTPEALLAVHGVGAAKLEKYGEDFLAVVAEHAAV